MATANMKLALVLCFFIFGYVVQALVFPSLSAAFSVVTELTSLSRNETITLVEFVDSQQHALVEHYFPDNSLKIELYHFELLNLFTIYPASNSCTRSLLSNTSIVTTPNVIHATDVLLAANRSSMAFSGTTIVRNIAAELYSATVVLPFNGATRTFELTIAMTATGAKIYNSARPAAVPLYATLNSVDAIVPAENLTLQFMNYVAGDPAVIYDSSLFKPYVYCPSFLVTPFISIPPLPAQHQVVMTVNQAQLKQTFTIVEYYDSINDRYRQIVRELNKTTIEHYWSVKTGIFYEIDPVAQLCNTSSIPTDVNPFVSLDSVISLASLHSFGRSPQAIEEYNGQETVNGILCDKWTRYSPPFTLGAQTVSSNATFYYSVPQWNMMGTTSSRVPVRFTFQINMSKTGAVNYQVNFANFLAGSDIPYYMWDIPDYCNNVNNPPQIPQFPAGFAAEIEISDTRSARTQMLIQYYDSEKQRMRIDSFGVDQVNRTYLLVKDKKLISVTNNLATCDETNLTPQMFNGTLPPVEQALLFTSPPTVKTTRTYRGRKSIRGILCDQWKTEWVDFFVGANNTPTLMQYSTSHYFAVANWYLPTAPGPKLPIPIRIDYHARPNNAPDREEFHVVDLSIDFINFMPRPPTDDDFVLPLACPSSTMRYTVALVNAAAVTAGISITVAVIGLLLGSAIGFIIGWVVFKRKPGQKKSNAPRELEEQ